MRPPTNPSLMGSLDVMLLDRQITRVLDPCGDQPRELTRTFPYRTSNPGLAVPASMLMSGRFGRYMIESSLVFSDRSEKMTVTANVTAAITKPPIWTRGSISLPNIFRSVTVFPDSKRLFQSIPKSSN